MKILVVYYTHKPGGLCHRLYRLMRALAERGHEVHYLTLDQVPEGSLPPAVRVRILKFPIDARSGLLFWCLYTLSCSLTLSTLVRGQGYQRLLLFHPFYVLLSVIGLHFGSAKLVLFIRALPDQIAESLGKGYLRITLERAFLKWACRRAWRLVAISRVMAERLSNLTGRRDLQVLANDIPAAQKETELFEAADSSKLILLSSGVLDARKNVRLVIEAIAELGAKLGQEPPVTLLVAGQGPELEPLRRLASGLRITDSVRFLGWVPDLAARLAQVEIVIHSALHEGMSNSLLEALAAGKITLASKIPEHLELLGMPELLFSTDNALELATTLEKILYQPGFKAQLSRLCRERAVRYSFDWDQRAVELVEK
jgi:glycosyltransferase involved in cell wall biosynthesis